MINYNHLYYFHVVAVEGTVAAAAARLRVTQPTVSEQLRTLERSLGVRLFERQASGLRLTEEGRVTFDHTSQMFRAGERLMQALGHDVGTPALTLSVGISTSVGRVTSTEFLMPLLALDGSIPSIRTGDALELIRALRGNDLDLALVESEPPAAARQGLEVVELNRVTLVAVAPPEVEPTPDWHDVRLVHYRPSSAFRWDVDAFLDDNGLCPVVAGEADDSLFLLEAAAHGGFVAFVPRSVARDAIATGRLRALATVTANHAVYAVVQDAEAATLARHAISLLIDHARALEELTR